MMSLRTLAAALDLCHRPRRIGINYWIAALHPKNRIALRYFCNAVHSLSARSLCLLGPDVFSSRKNVLRRHFNGEPFGSAKSLTIWLCDAPTAAAICRVLNPLTCNCTTASFRAATVSRN